MCQAGIYRQRRITSRRKAAGTDDAKTVIAEMNKMPVNDFMTENGSMHEDERMMRDTYLLQVKKPAI